MFSLRVRSYENLRVQNLIEVKIVQKIAIAFFNGAVDDKNFLRVFLVAMTIFVTELPEEPIVLCWVLNIEKSLRQALLQI